MEQNHRALQPPSSQGGEQGAETEHPGRVHCNQALLPGQGCVVASRGEGCTPGPGSFLALSSDLLAKCFGWLGTGAVLHQESFAEATRVFHLQSISHLLYVIYLAWLRQAKMLLKGPRAIKREGGLGEGARGKGWVLGPACEQGAELRAHQPLRALGMLVGVSGTEQAAG